MMYESANQKAVFLDLHRYNAALDAKFLLPQLRRRREQDVKFYAMNMQMYLLVTGYSSTFFLFAISPLAMDLLLTTAVYEPPKSFQNFGMSALQLVRVGHMKMCYDYYIALHRGTILSFLSLSLIPGAYAFFLYRFANKYGEQYYTGAAPVPTGWGGASVCTLSAHCLHTVCTSTATENSVEQCLHTVCTATTATENSVETHP
jgi:hypothetical protein